MESHDGKVVTAPAVRFLNPLRFDVFAKLFYIRYREQQPRLAAQVYLKNIRCIVPTGKEWGKEQEKSSFAEHIKVFDELIECFRNGDFDPAVSLVPVGADDNLLDGAHRTAVLAYYRKPVTVCRFDDVRGDMYDYAWFLARGMSVSVADRIVLEALDWLEDVSVHCLGPDE
ncbi:MAG: hypothetical protein K5910_06970, partial [Bacteroidales bacterium]|nr:hypothetical protein [Bacteroidales bacterium]